MYWCFLAGTLLFAPCVRSQTPIEPAQPVDSQQRVEQPQPRVETPQQVNERIRALSAKTPAPAPHEYVIGKGDLVGVEVYEVPELSRDVRVSQTGTIGLPLLPARIYVVGLTELQLEQKIAEVLEADGLVTNPRVMITVKDKKSKPITIVGAIPHPMVFHADREMTLIQLLAEAGGILPDASDTVLITRGQSMENTNPGEPPEIGTENTVPMADPSASPNGAAAPTGPEGTATKNNSDQAPPALSAPAPVGAEPRAQDSVQPASQNPGAPSVSGATPAISGTDAVPLPATNIISVNLTELLERGDLANNIPLQAGDVVTVPHAGIIYALGAVQKPGGFVANNDRAQLSTLKVLALAGGMTRVAKKAHAVIIRKDAAGKQQSIPVDLGRIVKQETEDVRLLPSDILYVPDNNTKATLLRAMEIGIGLGTGLVIYRLTQ